MMMLWIKPEAASTSWVCIAGAFGFFVSFAPTYGPILGVYLFEMFPAEIKDIGGGCGCASHWINATIVVFAATILEADVMYTILFIINLAAFVFIYLTMKETKGRVVGDS